MKHIEFMATYANGDTERIYVRARTVNSGFAKAVKRASEPLGNGTAREIKSLTLVVAA